MKNALLFMVMMPLLVITLNSCFGEKMIDIEKETKKEIENGKTKLVKKVTFNWIGEQSGYTEFFYNDKQQLIKSGANPYYDTYKYENNRIIQDNIHIPQTIIYNLDNNGYVIKMDIDNKGHDDFSMAFEYFNGYLAKTVGHTYTWDDGNLVKVVNGTQHFDTITFTYNNVLNKMNIGITTLYNYNPEVFIDDSFLNLKGWRSKNFPITASENGVPSFVYSYIYDADGYPTEIKGSNYEEKVQKHRFTLTITYY